MSELTILFHANAPWCCTGYGVQGKHLTKGWQRLGHRVFYSAYYGMRGGTLTLGGMTILSGGLDAWGNDIIEGHCKRTKADLVVSLVDVWVLDPEVWSALPARWAPWFPVDQLPVPPKVADHAMRSHFPLVYSKFAQQAMEEIGLHARYIPHGVDTSVFRAADSETRAEMREREEVEEGAFLVGMVAANKDNPSRKNFWQQMEAFSIFRERHPDANAKLHMHTLPLSLTGGCPISEWAAELGIGDVTTFPATYNYVQGFTDERMSRMYNCFDVLLSASHGEGFGIPILEAQACGIPVITTDWTAMPELTWSGLSLPVVATFKTPLGGCWGIPSLDDIVGALEEIYSWSDVRRAKERERAECQASRFDWNLLMDAMWAPLLEDVAEEIEVESPFLVSQPSVCESKGHQWAPTGIWISGVFTTPCQRPRCEAMRQLIDDGGWRESPSGFDLTLDGQQVELQDDPRGGVWKIVLYELNHGYIPGIDVNAGDVILDIGAHVGVVSIYLAKRYPQARILAFEPVPENYERLCSNLSRNDAQNVEAINAAVTGDGRDVRLCGKPDKNSGGFSEFAGAKGAQTVMVPSMTLSDIYAKYDIDHCRLMKLDAEGAEYDILYSSEPLLDRIDYLCGEFHYQHGCRGKADDLRDWCVIHLGLGRVFVKGCEIGGVAG